MELAFAKKSLRLLCEDEVKARQQLGARIAAKLKRRLADLRAASSVSELIAGTSKEIQIAGRRYMAVDLCDGARLVFRPNHSEIPVLDSGGVNWSLVNRIKIVQIGEDDG